MAFAEHPDPHRRHKKAVPVGIVFEHRFAFYYWIKLKEDLRYERYTQRWTPEADFVAPDLVTMDWHDDIGGECDMEESQLRRLDQRNESEVALFCWAGLRSVNDGHVYPALWLNAIGDVYALIKQGNVDAGRRSVIKDRYGNEHMIRYCRRPEQIVKARRSKNNPPGVIWDIDLDFFTQTSEVPDQQYTPALTETQVRQFLDPKQEWVREILCSLEAITIALEPEYTGGLSTSLRLFQTWERCFFSKPLFDKRCSWRPILR